jgi:hypothetical protein
MDKTEKEGGRSESLVHSNISLVLNSYGDIFSSFDARGFSEKALSGDFLEECQRAARDKDDKGIELILAMPREKRNLSDEIKIKKRLREHFHKHFLEKEREIRRIKRTGFKWIGIGTFLMIFATLIHTYAKTVNLFFSFLLVVSEPAGWFSFWEGLAKIFIDSEEVEPEISFYKKMAGSDILFISY